MDASLRDEELKLARRALRFWNIDDDPKFIQSLENAVFGVRSGDARRVLRLTHESHRSVALIAAELDGIEFLDRSGVPVAPPIESANGSLTEILESDGGNSTAVLIPFVEGRRLSYVTDPDDWNHEAHATWGRLLGRIHAALRNYEPPLDIEPRFRWDTEPRYRNARSVLSTNPEFLAEYDACWTWMQSLPTGADAFGLIHGDAHRGNFFVGEDGGFTLFDFDDCLYSWFAMDLAMPVFYSKIHPHRPDWGRAQLDELLTSLIAGYREHHPITDEWVQRIWGFIRWRRVQLYICGYYWDRRGIPDALDGSWFAKNQEPLGLGELPLV